MRRPFLPAHEPREHRHPGHFRALGLGAHHAARPKHAGLRRFERQAPRPSSTTVPKKKAK